MQQELAKQLLSKIMDWEPSDVVAYLSKLEDWADWKYDTYQQYRPGSRFLENLAVWLNQFETLEEKKCAFNFVLDNLIYVSPTEMNRLVGMAYTDVILPLLKKQVRDIINNGSFLDSDYDDLMKVYTKEIVFLGLSDGARTDVFRRMTPEIRHDQISLTYELADSKLDDIKEHIEQEVSQLEITDQCKHFASDPLMKNIVLLDDFSASGISFIRQERIDGKDVWKGKIVKLLNLLEGYISSETIITLILYISTEKAISYIQEKSKEYLQDRQISINVETLQTVHPYVPKPDEMALLAKYYNSDIEDIHYLKGKHNQPYLGFDECSLPVVLSHNTPNNSFPILWSTEKALFPRVARHKEV